MRSLLATFLVSLLLLSNGMMTAVIDVCCANNAMQNSQEVSCCAPKKDPSTPSCCENDANEEVITHESCEFDSWYYFTAKYFEKTTQNSKSECAILFNKSIPKFSIALSAQFKSAQSGIEHPPPRYIGRIALEQFSVWII